MAHRWGNSGNSVRLFLGAPKSLQMMTAAMKLKDACSLEAKLRQNQTKKQRHHFADKGLSSQVYGFPSGHVWMWELDHKESWAPKKWCFWTVVLEKTLDSPLDCKELKPVSPKGNQLWCWERWKAGGEEDDRGWDRWMTSRTQWTWVWASSRSWWWTGKPGELQSMGSQRVRHVWSTLLHEIMAPVPCSLRIMWPKSWSFSFSISPSNEYSGLTSFLLSHHHLPVRGEVWSQVIGAETPSVNL